MLGFRRRCNKQPTPCPLHGHLVQLLACSQDVKLYPISHWMSRIDVRYWPKLDQNLDIYRTSWDIMFQCQIQTCSGPSLWHPLDISMTSELDIGFRHILDYDANVQRSLSGYEVWSDKNRTFPNIQAHQVQGGQGKNVLGTKICIRPSYTQQICIYIFHHGLVEEWTVTLIPVGNSQYCWVLIINLRCWQHSYLHTFLHT